MSGDWSYGFLLKIFAWGYLLGGLTLLPTVLVFAWFWTTSTVDLEVRDALGQDAALGLAASRESQRAKAERDGGSSSLGLGLDEETLEKLKGRTHVPDVCAGYFAVCREYVPGGVNGKPPDRTTPAGAVVSSESPSVYQSMYRSIFDRNKTLSPSIEAANTRSKKARNVFYVVLRLGHLMLYDNEDQLEVRHVISLAYYKIDVYGGVDRIPEGELWIKRNCIRLRQNVDSDIRTESKSFYLFSDNCSEKEDFFHAMLQAQEHHKDPSSATTLPVPLKFDTPDLVKLVQQLHASEENLHTRWINALIGRVFLALYKTSHIKEIIAAKINKKIARVPKPAIISSVQLRRVDMGTLPPFITNPKLKELTVDGDLIVETDVSYKGNFRIEVSATVRIDLGPRFKAREVTLILATVLKKLEGHLLIRIKPPPSNRLWITFETPPRMEFSLEPIVSTRQVTYGPVLRAIESRIREVVNETLVLPNWDDMPFTDTLAQSIRGGIWTDDTKPEDTELPATDSQNIPFIAAAVDTDATDSNTDFEKSSVASQPSVDEPAVGISSATEVHSTPVRPRTLRSSSSAAQVKLDSAHASAEIVQDHNSLTPSSVKSLPLASPVKPQPQPKSRQAANTSDSSSEDISTASISGASTKSVPITSFEQSHTRTRSRDLTLQEIATAAAAAAEANNMPRKQTLNQTLNSASAAAKNWLIAKHNARTGNTQANTQSNNNSQSENPNPGSVQGKGINGDAASDTRPRLLSQSSVKSHTEPIGRGQPLPPPGTPLPPPKTEKRQTWAVPAAAAAASTFANLTKRKPAPAPHGMMGSGSQEHLDLPGPTTPVPMPSPIPYADLPSSLHDTEDTEDIFRKSSLGLDSSAEGRRRKSSAASSTHSNQAPPPLPKRRQRQPSLNAISHQRRPSQIQHMSDDVPESLLVIEAPLAEGSASPSPIDAASSTLDADTAEVGKRGTTGARETNGSS